MKLGFAIKVVSAGAGEPLAFNKGPWVKKVVDKRDYLKLFSGLQGTDKHITFLTFDENGCFVTVMRSIPGREGDSLSGWIYIPSSVDISGEQVVKVYNFVCDILKESNISNCTSDIEEVFSASYPEKEHIVRYAPNAGDKYGVRFLDQYPLTTVLGTNRYQSYYSKFDTVFLLDKNSGIGIAKEHVSKFGDLRNAKFEEYSTLKNPTPEEVRLLGRNVKVKLANGQDFISPIAVAKGSYVNLLLTKDGFESIPCRTQVLSKDIEDFPTLPDLEWKKRITTSSFDILDSENRPVSTAKIAVNGVSLESEMMISEEQCKSLTYEVSAFGFETQKGSINFLYESTPIRVVLHREVKQKKYNIIMSNGRKSSMVFESRNLQSSFESSPLRGYSYDPDKDAYDLSDVFILKQRLIGILYAILIAVLVTMFKALVAWWDSVRFDTSWPFVHSIKVENTEIGNNEGDLNDADEPSAEDMQAIFYLDNIDVWNKDSLDKYELTRGVFDEMNEFRLDNFRENHSKLVNGSVNMKRVCEAMEDSRETNIEPKKGKEQNGGKYNADNDKKIKIDKYIEWIKQDQSSKPINVQPISQPQKPAPPQTSNKISGGNSSTSNAAKATSNEEKAQATKETSTNTSTRGATPK